MNDEETVIQPQGTSDQTESNSISQKDEAIQDSDVPGEPAADAAEATADLENDMEDPDLPTDSMPCADTDSGASSSPNPSGGLELLRGELNRLQAELALREERMERLGEECAEFCQLYPEVSPGSLPDGVWQDVKRGIHLAAAYALAERKRACATQRAEQSNLHNQMRSAGEIRTGENDVYSPAEVRTMTPEQVRANYSKIMRSMQKWH